MLQRCKTSSTLYGWRWQNCLSIAIYYKKIKSSANRNFSMTEFLYNIMFVVGRSGKFNEIIDDHLGKLELMNLSIKTLHRTHRIWRLHNIIILKIDNNETIDLCSSSWWRVQFAQVEVSPWSTLQQPYSIVQFIFIIFRIQSQFLGS